MSDQFKVVFSGTIVEGFDAETVISAFAEKFRCSEAKARALVLSGKETVIKSDLDKAKAEKYHSALVGIGLDAELVSLQPAVKKPVMFELEKDEPAGSNDQSDSGALKSCPKCGSKQIADDRCLDCKIVISKYIAIQENGGVVAAASQQTSVASDKAPAASTGNTSSASFDYNATAATDNPYHAPQADLNQEYEEGELTDPASLPMSHGWRWLSGGFGHFKNNPVAWIVAILLWIFVYAVLGLIPVIGDIILMLISPVVVAGFMLGCHSQEMGGNFTIGHLLSGFSKNAGQLILVGLLYLLASIAVMVPFGLYAGFSVFAGSFNPDAMGMSLVLVLLLSLFLMFIPLMAYWFAPALVVLNDMSAIEAMKLSFAACLKNILPGILYFILATLLFIIGTIPFALGLLVVIPMISASMYTSYRDVFYS